MKRIALLISIITILFVACKNNKPKESISGKDSTALVMTDTNQMNTAKEDMEKKKDELTRLTPLSMDELKAMIPETLMDGKRTSLDANNSSGSGLATADYDINDSTHITLSIIDCGGPGGAGIYGLQYMNMINVDESDEEEYTKTIDFNGGKAFEHCDKTSNDCTLTWFTGGRFLITLEGNKIGADALKQAARSLHIK